MMRIRTPSTIISQCGSDCVIYVVVYTLGLVFTETS